MDSLHSEHNPFIKTTSSQTLLLCANQLAQTLSALRTTLATESREDSQIIARLPSRLLSLPPLPSKAQCDDIEQPLRHLHAWQYTLSQRADTQTMAAHVDTLSQIIQAVRHVLHQSAVTLV